MPFTGLLLVLPVWLLAQPFVAPPLRDVPDASPLFCSLYTRDDYSYCLSFSAYPKATIEAWYRAENP